MKKGIKTIALAMAFGVTASASFQGSNLLIEQWTGKEAQAEAAEGVQLNQTLGQNIEGGVNTGSFTGGTKDISAIASQAMPSVVSITNKSVQEMRLFGQSQAFESESRGTGIIIGQTDTELLLVTNHHVVNGADEISVGFVDGEIAEAKRKGSDTGRDLAVLSVKMEELSDKTKGAIRVIELGKSSELQVGEQVVAIGNALGYGQSVTTGIVSALNREVIIENNTNTLIQTDAAINPGNSGGALLNMDGQLVGINSAKYSDTNVEGMGYAIPVDDVVDIIEGLMNRTIREEKAPEGEQGFLGITGQDVTSDVSDAYDMPKGVYITSVEEGSGAAAAGLKKGDIITRFDGSSVGTLAELKEQLSYYKTGEQVKLTVSMAAEGEYQEQVVTVLLGKNQEK
ncbi:MAG: trypsin-like serine protease [Lachnospiraceae bacterium]|uniref:S1C family serine protease n=1 Tax=Candidatus Merdisoma sp. JLR.KK011 TaxID=3114299 RepID=UPI0014348A46|nr:trypsin-like serine protease [Lachnospiraceae bacterium]MCI9480383.1 trypsin-like serine protease [Lachnospiraceae bacterium]MCI9624868.1 trypsin-like serine protease [Lachnospiraceae bacterium]GFI08508.1 periplasmic pH-dependent serine endoprotease DegQ [Lachnospiraceae bacterium]